MRTRQRLVERLALGGVLGPVGFVVAWVMAGAAARHYSPSQDAISELARIDAPTRPAMTAGFLIFGIGVTLYGLALRSALPGKAWASAVATGVSTLGVAAFPLGSPFTDAAHGVCATAGYVTLAATPLLAAGPLHRRGRIGWSRAALSTGVASAACLAASVLDSRSGLFQRLGLTITDAWIVASALVLMHNGKRA